MSSTTPSVLNPNKHHKLPLLVIIGSTASGKSDCAVSCALRYGGEVVSADSRQVFVGLDATTGKVSSDEMRGVPHHMLGTINPGDEYSVHHYRSEAIRCVEEIYARGALPIICGGTGFYIESILFENSIASVPADITYREHLATQDLTVLQQQLQKKDPDAFDRIDTSNPRRVIRALEVIHKTGKFAPIKRKNRYEYCMVGLSHSRQALRDRIEKRLDARFVSMVDEIRHVIRNGVDPIWLDGLGLECRHISRMIVKGISEKETRANLLRAIVAYAKRQDTWWNRYPNAQWYHQNEIKEMYTFLDNIYRVK